MAQDDPGSQLVPPAKDAKGRFLPGHKLARGRPKGSENKFGPSFRERLLAGISRAGVKKAKKAGTNQKVDGLEYYIEDLASNNGAATASIISKLIPPPEPESTGGGTMVVNIVPVVSGTWFSREACEQLRETGRLPLDAVIHLVDLNASLGESTSEAAVIPLYSPPPSDEVEDDEPPDAA
jgi:hypothetical protein